MQTRLGCAFIVVLAFVASASGQNTGQRLLDGSATFDYTTNGNGNLPLQISGLGNVSMNFQLDGTPGLPSERQLTKGNWFYRISTDSRERYPTSQAAVKSTVGSNYVKWDFPEVFDGASSTIPGAGAEMEFRLTSHNPDSATLTTGLCFYNNGSTPYDVDAFFAVDFQLAATSLGDDFQMLDNTQGRLIRVNDGSTSGALYGGNAFGGAIGSAMGSDAFLFGALNDGNPDNFPDVNFLGGNFGDGAALLEFNATIQPFSPPVCFPVTLAIARNGETPRIPGIPEPSGLALAAGLTFVIGLRRPTLF